MVAWFIVAIATLAMFGYVAFTGVGLTNAQATSGATIELVRRLNVATSAIAQKAADPNNDGVLLLPVGKPMPSGGGWMLPSSLDNLSTSPLGQPYIYCPFGSSSASDGGTATIPSADGSSYAVTTVAGQFDTYVAGNRPNYAGVSALPNLMGYLIASRVKGVVPSCDAVSYDSTSGLLSENNAIVRGIYRQAAEQPRAGSAQGVVWYVSPGIADGAGSGLSIATPSSLNDAISYFRTNQPNMMRIMMADGSYTYAQNSMNQNYVSLPNYTRRSSLAFAAENLHAGPTSNSVTMTQTGGGTIDLPTDTAFYSVNLDAATKFVVETGHVAQFNNSQTGPVSVNFGSKVLFVGSDDIEAPTDGTMFNLTVNGGGQATVIGSVIVHYVNGGLPIYLQPSGNMIFINGTMTFSNATSSAIASQLFTTSKDSTLTMVSATVSILGGWNYAVVNQGNYYGNTVTFSLAAPGTAVFANLHSSTWRFDNSTITATAVANLPYADIDDQAGESASASNTTLHASVWCWRPNTDLNTDNIYRNSPPGNVTSTNGSTSAVTADEQLPGMSATPTSSEIQAYDAAQQRNSERAASRRRNTTAMTCTVGS